MGIKARRGEYRFSDAGVRRPDDLRAEPFVSPVPLRTTVPVRLQGRIPALRPSRPLDVTGEQAVRLPRFGGTEEPSYTDEYMKLNIPYGMDLSDALTLACKKAARDWVTVTFDFNGEVFTVQPADDAEALMRAWERRQAAAQRAYRADPAWVTAETARAQRTADAQAKVNTFLTVLEFLGTPPLAAAVKLIWMFQPPLDEIGVLVPWGELAETFGRVAPAGWGVGRENLSEPGNEADTARWIVGQAVRAFEQGHAPHPRLAQIAEELVKELPKEAWHGEGAWA